MTAKFEAWVESLYRHDQHDPGKLSPGVMDLLRATFDARGPVSVDDLDEIFDAKATELAREGVALFIADVGRTSDLTPRIEISLDTEGFVKISFDGSYNAPAFFARRAPEAISEVADNLRDHVMHDLCAAWPLCPIHGFGLDPRTIAGQAVWFCRYRSHVVSTIGMLPSTAAARDGLADGPSARPKAGRPPS